MEKSSPTHFTITSLYLDLMKRCLIDSLFIDDPLVGFAPYRFKDHTSNLKRAAIATLERFLSRYRVRLVEQIPDAWSSYIIEFSTEELKIARESGTRWPKRAHTMIGLKRLNNLQYCVEKVIREGIPGDLIETGVWRGGACIFMRAILKAYGETERTVWLADSFAGLPLTNASVYTWDAGDIHHTWTDWLAVSREEVEDNFRRYDLLDSQVRFLKGWFKDTLPDAPIKQLSVLRLDGDMYESTIQALDALYDKLSPGGFVIVDDYFLKPCAKAIHDFREARGITDEILEIDEFGAYWRRSTRSSSVVC